MPLDSTDGTPAPPRASISLVPPVQPVQASPDGMPAEHIYIGDDAPQPVAEPVLISKRFRLANWVKGMRTEIIFFAEGFIKIREFKRGKLSKDHLLELRFLNLEPATSRIVALPFFWAAVSLAAIATLTQVLSVADALAAHLNIAFVLAATAATVALLLFIYRSSESFSFYTNSGDAEVLTLRSNIGCIHRCRDIVPQITGAIREATDGDDLHEEAYLRAETQAHYRLHESGVITREACSDGISLILSKFS